MAATDSHSFNWKAGPSVNLSFEYELSITLLTDKQHSCGSIRGGRSECKRTLATDSALATLLWQDL